MEIVAVIQALWHRRLLVALGLVPALAIGVMMMGRPGAPASGYATTRVVLDTQMSQLVTPNPSGMDTLWWRATVLATMLGTDKLRAQMAREMRVPVDELAVVDNELSSPMIPASLPKAAADVDGVVTAPYVLHAYSDGTLPIVYVEASAPTRAEAARLADAPVHAMENTVSTVETKTLQGLTVSRVSPVEAKTIPAGSGKMKAAMATFVLFFMWATGVALAPAIRDAWRTVVEARATHAG